MPPFAVKTAITDSPEEAARYIRKGELAAFPTETVYGLGANALEETAIRKIYAAKSRPADNPLIVHLSSPSSIPSVASSIPEAGRLLIDRFMPGPITLILPRASHLPGVVSAGLPTVGVRVPRHPTAQAFLKACRKPVAAPSANLSGRPSPTTWQAVQDDLSGRIACILTGAATEVGLESTVVDCTRATPAVLRAGAITLEQLRGLLPSITISGSQPLSEEASARSPGTRHRHYAPTAQVHLVAHPDEVSAHENAAYIGLDPPSYPGRFQRIARCGDVASYARRLFDFFRQCDQAGLRVIYCQCVASEGLGLALMDRMERAARR